MTDLISHLKKKIVWTDFVILAITTAMLKTSHYLYLYRGEREGWMSVEKSMAADIWNDRDKLEDVPAYTGTANSER